MRMIFMTMPVLVAIVFGLANSAAPVSAGDEALLRALDRARGEAARAEAVAALAERRSEPVRKALEAIAADTGEPAGVRMQAICALAGSATRESVPVLLGVLEKDLEQRRGFWACAIPLLGDLKDRRAVALLTKIANLDREHLAGMDHMAIEALTRVGDSRELPLFMAKAHIAAVRSAVIRKLAEIASPDTVDILIEALAPPEEAEVVEAAERGLRKIGKPARAGLRRALSFREADPAFLARVRALLVGIDKARKS